MTNGTMARRIQLLLSEQLTLGDGVNKLNCWW